MEEDAVLGVVIAAAGNRDCNFCVQRSYVQTVMQMTDCMIVRYIRLCIYLFVMYASWHVLLV